MSAQTIVNVSLSFFLQRRIASSTVSLCISAPRMAVKRPVASARKTNDFREEDKKKIGDVVMHAYTHKDTK